MNSVAEKVVFVDRDGVLNKKAPSDEYVRNWDEFQLIPDAVPSVARLNEAGFRVFVVTNQRGIARGRVRLPDLEEIHERLRDRFETEGAHLSGIYYCPHDYEDRCECRKPKPGMLLRAARDNGFQCTSCWMIGDSDSDIEAGRRAGCRTVRINPNGSESHVEADFTAPNLPVAVQFIIENT